MERIELVRDRIFSGVVCCDVDPDSENAFDEVDRLAQTIYNGTTAGWRSLRKSDCELRDIPWDESKPGPCEDYPNRWHYVVIT